jgi:hypothetical protein
MPRFSSHGNVSHWVFDSAIAHRAWRNDSACDQGSREGVLYSTSSQFVEYKTAGGWFRADSIRVAVECLGNGCPNAGVETKVHVTVHVRRGGPR